MPHRDRGLAHELARSAAGWFRDRGVEVRVPAEEAKAVDLGRARRRRPTDFAAGLDLVVSLGGDGTMLHAVDLVYPAPVPILGVNVGQLGYLTEVEPDELEASMPRLRRRRLRGVGAHGARGAGDVARARRRARGSRSTRPRSRSSAAAT